MLNASDNYDGDISSEIVIVSDTYTMNSSLVGDYQMTFSVTVSSGNIQTYIQEISVIDSEAPIISGIISIVIGYDSVITEADILENLSCTDNYDLSGLNLILESNSYSDNHNVIGNYEMEFSVTDSSGNKTSQIVSIEVVDEIGPVVYFNSSIIQTYTDTVMALPDFLLLLRNAHEIDQFTDYYVTASYDSYTNNARVPGVYHLNLTLTNDLGDRIDKNLEINVIDRPIDYIQVGEVVVDQNESFFSKFSDIIIGGSLAIFLIVSNVVWVVVLKKR